MFYAVLLYFCSFFIFFSYPTPAKFFPQKCNLLKYHSYKDLLIILNLPLKGGSKAKRKMLEMMNWNKNKKVAAAKYSGAVEADTILKHGRSRKSVRVGEINLFE